MSHFSIGLWHAMKSGFYTTSDDQLGSWTEKKLQGTSQSQTCTKRSRSLFGGLLPSLTTIAFWILAKSLHLRSTLNKLMRSTENCNACHHWAKEGSSSSPWQHLTAHCTSNTSEVELWSFASSATVTWPLATDYHFFKHLDNFFVGKTLPQSAGDRKCFPRVRWIPKHGFLCYKNKQTYFLLAKMCWL